MKAFRSMVAGVVLLVAGLLMASPTSAVATSSVADPQFTTCPSNHFCLYENTNWGGGVKVYANGESDSDMTDTHYNNGHVVNDTASSMINNTGRSIVLFRDTRSRVICYSAQANSVDSTFTNNTCTQDTSISVNDHISSSAVT